MSPTFRSFGYLLISTAIVCTSCAAHYTNGEVVRETRYQASPYTVIEKVQFDYSGEYGDDFFKRVYAVEMDGEEAIAFTGESDSDSPETNLMGHPPKQADGWLAIFSESRMWIWQPGKEAIAFKPSTGERYVAAASQRTLPERIWTYQASNFWIENDQWILEYSPSQNTSNLKEIYFVSKDEGQTFSIQTERPSSQP